MLKAFVPVALTIALFCCPCGQFAFAQSLSDPNAKSLTIDQSTASIGERERPAQPSEKLKQDVLNMVADAKSGKISVAKPQVQAQRNNLSKGQKIAIIAGIAAAVVVVILVVKHKRDHLFDGLTVF